MNNIWAQVIADIEPELDSLTEAMTNGPQFPITVQLWEGGWLVRIHQEWAVDINARYFEWHPMFEKRCIWAQDRLCNQDSISRQSWASWKFEQKQDAEKFMTLYGLVWGS